MTTHLSVKQLDDLLLGSYARLEADRAVSEASWPAYLRTITPEPPFYDVFARRRWRAAFAIAAKLPVKTKAFVALVLPVWAFNNEDEVDGSDWTRATLFVFEDGDFLEVPGAFEDDVLVVARVERCARPRLSEVDWFPPNFPTLYRDEQYVVTAADNPERVVSIVAEHAIAGTPKPTRVVPAFSADMEAAIDLDAAMPVLGDLGASDVRAAYREHGADRWRALIQAALADHRFMSDELT